MPSAQRLFQAPVGWGAGRNGGSVSSAGAAARSSSAGALGASSAAATLFSLSIIQSPRRLRSAPVPASPPTPEGARVWGRPTYLSNKTQLCRRVNSTSVAGLETRRVHPVSYTHLRAHETRHDL